MSQAYDHKQQAWAVRVGTAVCCPGRTLYCPVGMPCSQAGMLYCRAGTHALAERTSDPAARPLAGQYPFCPLVRSSGLSSGLLWGPSWDQRDSAADGWQ